jgi:hypothetical protein
MLRMDSVEERRALLRISATRVHELCGMQYTKFPSATVHEAVSPGIYCAQLVVMLQQP